MLDLCLTLSYNASMAREVQGRETSVSALEKTNPGFERLKQFTRAVVEEGVHLAVFQTPRPHASDPQKKEKRVGEDKERWARDFDIYDSYVDEPDATLQQIGEESKYNLSREGVRKIVLKTARTLYIASPPEIQEQYPFDTFDFSKPLSAERRFQMSESRGGQLRTVVDLMRQGKNAEEIRSETGLTSDQLAKLRSRGYPAPYLQEVSSPEFRKALEQLNDPTLPFEERQPILEKIGIGYIQENHTSIQRLSEVIQEAGLKISGKRQGLRSIVRALNDARFPANIVEVEVKTGNRAGNTQRYGVIAVCDREAVSAYLYENEELQRRFGQRPVRLVAGQAESLPSTYMLKTSDYVSIQNMVEKSKVVSLRHHGITLPKLIADNCPVPVFTYRKEYRCPQDQQDVLRAYLEERIQYLLSE